MISDTHTRLALSDVSQGRLQSHPLKSVFLSVVIPAYNEEKRLPRTLKAVVGWLGRRGYTWEVVVVDDGSGDRTADIVRETSLVEERVRLVRYGVNKGKGYAVRYGMLRAKGDLRLFMDADNSTTIDHLEHFLHYLKTGFDVVIGSRDVAGSFVAVHQPWWKEKLGDLGNVWVRVWAVPGIRDTQAGFKVFSARAAEDIFSRLTIDRWGFDVEALAVARLLGYKVIERPIRWVNDADSKVSPAAYLQVFKEVVQVRINMWRGKYTGMVVAPQRAKLPEALMRNS